MDDGTPLELDTELITITIGNVNRPPEFTPIGSQEVLENELIEFQVLATDPDGNNLTYTAGVLPDGAVFNQAIATFTWTPQNDQAGNYSVLFYATDDGNPNFTGEIEVVITVGDVPTPAEIDKTIKDYLEDLFNDGIISENTYNSYMAHLKKVIGFIEDGKFTPATNQICQFISKVERDIADYNPENPEEGISPEDGNYVIGLANDLLEIIGGVCN
jgi:hypothetical protein